MIRNFEVVILILALSFDSHVHTGKIFGGREVAAHSRPYMVLLEIVLWNGTTTFCGGFILNEDFVMTAAHCQAKNYTVLLGLHNISNRKRKVSVKEAFPHKDFNRANYTNDLMLLKLSSKINFSSASDVGFIALPGQDDGSLPKSCSVSGWGRANRSESHMSNVLMEANVTLTDMENCPKEKSYCSEGESGPAEGDSGGPLVCGVGKAYGVVTSRITSSSGSYTYNYAKIPDYMSWIDSIMKNPGQA
uniref:granzyme G-like n=1 Tax=Semicossyphus pulcher TaxID=241346 RepID=UPI0037E7B79F